MAAAVGRLRVVSGFAAVMALLRRGVFNTVTGLVIIFKRWLRRKGNYPALGQWWLHLLALLSLTTVSVLAIDQHTLTLGAYIPEPVFRLARLTTEVGWGGWYFVPAAIVATITLFARWGGHARATLVAIYHTNTCAWFALLAVGLPGLLATFLQWVTGRPRPKIAEKLDLLGEGLNAWAPFSSERGYTTFPSGHAGIVGSVAAILILFFPQSRWVVIPLGIWFATTRVIVGAHYPSDVLIGFSVGFAGAVGIAVIFARLGLLFVQHPTGIPNLKPVVGESQRRALRRLRVEGLPMLGLAVRA